MGHVADALVDSRLNCHFRTTVIPETSGIQIPPIPHSAFQPSFPRRRESRFPHPPFRISTVIPAQCLPSRRWGAGTQFSPNPSGNAAKVNSQAAQAPGNKIDEQTAALKGRKNYFFTAAFFLDSVVCSAALCKFNSKSAASNSSSLISGDQP